MARPKKRTNNEIKQENKLLNALKFLSCVTKTEGASFETHVILNNYTTVAFNGILAAGIVIEEDINCCPRNNLMIQALSKCGQDIAITQLDKNRLSIKSGKFKVIIPCIEQIEMQLPIPDDPIIEITDKFKEGIEAVGVLANETGQDIITASILMNGQSLIASNKVIIFEYWHGLDMPTNLALPKVFADALTETNKKLVKFGYSNHSATCWFEDGSWLRTQLYAEQWPNLAEILDRSCNPFPVPADFWAGLAAVAPFSQDGLIHFTSGKLSSQAQEGTGATFEVAGLPGGPIFSARQLALIRPHAIEIDFLCPGPHGGTMLKFHGKNIRGCIAGRT